MIGPGADISPARYLDIRGGKEIVARIRAWACGIAGEFGADPRARADIALAISEAASNVVRHAYADQPECHLTLSARRIGGRIVVRMRDYGGKFDPAAVPPPKMDGELSIGGYGIYLMRRVMDKVHYITSHPVGTELILVRRCAS